MLQENKEFQKIFLLEFTKELIINSSPIFELEKIEKQQDLNKKQEIKKGFSMIKKRNEIQKLIQPLPIQRPPIRTRPRILMIPEPKLPPRLQYLRPTPTKRQIELGKLNPLIKDPVVKAIECNGADEKIIVKTPVKKTTDIILTKEEIDNIIKKFSETAKIPISAGVFRVVVGKLVLSAIISEVIGTKFIIKKIMYRPNFPGSR